MTKQRQEIYNVFSKSEIPLTAEMIYDLLPNNFLNLSTVYRTLEYFDNNSLVLRFFFNNKNHYILNNDQHHHYSICTNCLKMNVINCHLIDTINELENDDSFIVTNHEMTIYGLCSKCH